MSFSSWNLYNIAVALRNLPTPFLEHLFNCSWVFFFPPYFKWLAMLSASVNMHRRLLGTEVSLPPENGNKTHDSYLSETNFDTNLVVILAALLCALICAVGLNSIVRCALRCSRRFATETPEQAAARLATTGLKKRDLRQIPVAVYGEGVSLPSTECPICLGEFVDGEKVRVLPKCNHGFHVRCIDTWLLSHSSCPNCRHSLLEVDASKTETSQQVTSLRQPQNGLGGDHPNGSVVVVVG